MSLSLSISEDDYPEIFRLYKKDRTKKLEEIFITGYNIHFPNIKNQDKQLEYHTILKSIDEMKTAVSSENISSSTMDTRLEELLQSIQKLTGISNNSSKKGEVGETMLEEIITQRYGDIVFENKAKTPHSGDAWLHYPDKKIVMLESKNYSYRINKDEVEKMENDMKTNHIRFGVFASWNSVVQNRKDLDLHTFNHNGETYLIVVISNLGTDILKLDIAMQLIRKLSDYFYDMKKFPWIINDIKKNLNDLDQIIQKNYCLRDGFYSMSNGIRNSLDCFYQQLRDYQYEINSCAHQIIKKVENTMDTSSKKEIDFKSPDCDIFDEYKETKLFPILSHIVDTLTKMQVIIEKESLKMLRKDEEIGQIKIQKKKILVNLNKLNITLDIDPANYLEVLEIIPSICKNI